MMWVWVTFAYLIPAVVITMQILSPANTSRQKPVRAAWLTPMRSPNGPQIHAISYETHRKVHSLLTDHEKELEKAMQQREHDGRENR
jgi:hypothetical protein